jgi:hypothetical protein
VNRTNSTWGSPTFNRSSNTYINAPFVLYPVTLLTPLSGSTANGTVNLSWSNSTTNDAGLSFLACIKSTANYTMYCILTTNHWALFTPVNNSVNAWNVTAFNSTDSSYSMTWYFYGSSGTYIGGTVDILSFQTLMDRFWTSQGPWILMMFAAGGAYITMGMTSGAAVSLGITGLAVGFIFAAPIYYAAGVALLIIGGLMKVAGR